MQLIPRRARRLAISPQPIVNVGNAGPIGLLRVDAGVHVAHFRHIAEDINERPCPSKLPQRFTVSGRSPLSMMPIRTCETPDPETVLGAGLDEPLRNQRQLDPDTS